MGKKRLNEVSPRLTCSPSNAAPGPCIGCACSGFQGRFDRCTLLTRSTLPASTMSAPPASGKPPPLAGSATPLSNTDFRKLLATPRHPSMGAAPAAGTKPAAAAATPAAGKTTMRPGGSKSPAVAAAAAAGGKTPKFATDETRTVKFTRSGIKDVDGDGDDGEGGDGDGDGDDGEGGGAASSSAPRGKKEPRALSSRERSFIQFQQKQALKAEAKVKYRDRAKERQMDANPDYEGSVAPESLSIEASKYLGGDMAHTHLVKGLDFALLAKVKEELERQEEAKLEALVEAQQAAKKGGDQAAVAATSSSSGADAATPSSAAAKTPAAAPGVSKPLTPAQQSALNMNFGSTLAESIYFLTFDPPAPPHLTAPRQTDLFLPGRMTFDFPLPAPMASTSGGGGGGGGGAVRLSLRQAQQSANALPTTSLTSHTDLDAYAQSWGEEHANGTLPQQVHSKVVDLFARQRREIEERRELKRKRRAGEIGEEELTSAVGKAAPGLIAPPSSSAAASSSLYGVSSSSGGEAASAAAEAPEYTVARPPAAADDDSDDDIFAGAGSDYKAQVDEHDQGQGGEMEYSVPRPPPSPTEGEEEGAMYDVAAAPPGPATAVPLATVDPSIRQLDPRASRIVDNSDDSEDEDMFGGGISTRAGDELLAGVELGEGGAAAAGGGGGGAPLSAAERLKRKNALYAEAEYEGLFPEAAGAYGGFMDEDEDEDEPEEGSKKAKMLAKQKEAAAAGGAGGKGGGKTPLHRGGGDEDLDAKKREARFNAEYSQVASLLKQRGVKLNDEAQRRSSSGAASVRGAAAPTPRTAEEEERALKRQRILKGFATPLRK